MVLSDEELANIQKQLEGLSKEEQQTKINEIMSNMPPEKLKELQSQQCPFCLMSQGKIPVKKLYEDDKCIAILDINPANKGHTLVFPKNHFQFIGELPDDLLSHLFIVANKISNVLFSFLKAEGMNIYVASGAAAGQTAAHSIVNVIPRFTEDKVNISWEPQKLEEADMQQVVDAVKDANIFIEEKEEPLIAPKPIPKDPVVNEEIKGQEEEKEEPREDIKISN